MATMPDNGPDYIKLNIPGFGGSSEPKKVTEEVWVTLGAVVTRAMGKLPTPVAGVDSIGAFWSIDCG